MPIVTTDDRSNVVRWTQIDRPRAAATAGFSACRCPQCGLVWLWNPGNIDWFVCYHRKRQHRRQV